MIDYSKILKTRKSTIYNQFVKDDIRIASLVDVHISRLVGKKDIDNISDLKKDYKLVDFEIKSRLYISILNHSVVFQTMY